MESERAHGYSEEPAGPVLTYIDLSQVECLREEREREEREAEIERVNDLFAEPWGWLRLLYELWMDEPLFFFTLGFFFVSLILLSDCLIVGILMFFKS